jgi:ribosomal protein L18
MATSYSRRINLYINGEEVKNNIFSIRKEMSKLIGQQNHMTIGSEEYVKASGKIKQLKGIIDQHGKDIGKLETPWQKAIGWAKSLLPAFSFAAIGTMATKAFGQIINSTKELADKWEFSVAAMQSGISFFWKTLASGDWTNFFGNLETAVKIGYQYAEMLDSVKEKTWAMSVAEADARAEELRLEEAVKNKGLSKEYRIKAGQDRIKLEDELSAKRVKIADLEYDAEVVRATDRARLGKDVLMQVIADMDSETKAKAEAYNKQLEQYNIARKLNVKTTVTPYGGTSTIQKDDTSEITKMKMDLDSYPKSVQTYAEALRKEGLLTDEMIDGLVNSYTKKKAAENSSAENTKKVRTMVNSLLAGKEENGQKIEDASLIKKTKKEADEATVAIDLAYKQQLLLLKQKYANEETLQNEYKTRSLAAELAYMQVKLNLETSEIGKVDLQSQIIDKQREYTAALKETVPEILATHDGIDKLNGRLL